MAMVLISHDLGVVAENTDRVCVMYAGRIVEDAPIDTVFDAPAHPYTRGLLAALPELEGPRRALVPIAGVVPEPANLPPGCSFAPRCDRRIEACEIAPPLATELAPPTPGGLHPRMTALLEVSDLARTYDVRRGRWPFAKPATLHAVDGVSFELPAGRTLGLVGESGCGKTTTAKLVLGLVPLSAGEVRVGGEALPAANSPAWRALRRRMQMVYQDPLGALDRRLSVGRQVMEPLVIHGLGSTAAERREKALAMLDAVGLAPHHFDRFPHELSGGQRQRIVLARALILDPQLLVCDEPISALDVSIQAQVVNLLLALQQQLGLAYLFISHDLRMVRQVSHEVAVMYLGRIVEQGDPDQPVRDTGASVYAGAGVGDPDARARQEAPHRPAGRAAQSGRPSGRLRLPSALPPCRRRAAGSRRRRCASWPTAVEPPVISPSRSPDAALSRRAPAARHPDDLPRHHLRLLRPAPVGRSGDDDPVGRRAARIDQGLPRRLGPRPAAVGPVPRLYRARAAGRPRQLHARRAAGAPARARARAGDAWPSPCRPSCSSS